LVFQVYCATRKSLESTIPVGHASPALDFYTVARFRKPNKTKELHKQDNTILYKELSYTIIGTAMAVHRKLGCLLPEHIYSKALAFEFTKAGITCDRERYYKVAYDDQMLGKFYVDLIIDNKIILELKSDEHITQNHQSQLFTYLHISGIRVGYVFNFGVRKLQFKRLIL
jgi:GxxExxY protein